jgi:hypothetical protein
LKIKIYPENSGTVKISPDQTDYALNDNVTLTAVPNSGFEFYHWNKVVTDTVASLTIKLVSDTTIIINFQVVTRVCEDKNYLPTKLALFQNYPNPFNSSTIIHYDLPNSDNIEVIICNIKGQSVRVLVNEAKQAGSYYAVWDGKNDAGELLPSGIYLCILAKGSSFQVRKMILAK